MRKTRFNPADQRRDDRRDAGVYEPEQASGDPLDGRSDIYSLGVVLYQMLAGAPPFEGPSSASILAEQLTQAPVPIRRHRPDVPEEMAVVLERMMEKTRQQAISDGQRGQPCARGAHCRPRRAIACACRCAAGSA